MHALTIVKLQPLGLGHREEDGVGVADLLRQPLDAFQGAHDDNLVRTKLDLQSVGQRAHQAHGTARPGQLL